MTALINGMVYKSDPLELEKESCTEIEKTSVLCLSNSSCGAEIEHLDRI
jgi:hypothetical protein